MKERQEEKKEEEKSENNNENPAPGLTKEISKLYDEEDED